MRALLDRIMIIAVVASIISGCRGPEGPSGIDAQGVDILPPTLQLTEPWPLGQYWDRLLISAAAVDNVAVDRVIFTLDGSPAVGSLTMVLSSPPYRYILPLTDVSPGWHFVGARAYDLAGNQTEAAPRSIWLGHATLLSDTTTTIAYHNGITQTVFSIPDTSRAEAFWVRVTPAKSGALRSVIFRLGGTFSDSAGVSVGLWTGTSVPARKGISMTIPARVVQGELKPVEIVFSEPQNALSGEFYIVLEINKRSPRDTLFVGADSGTPPWGRSGLRDDSGWQLISERYGLGVNIIATSRFYYPPIPGDTTGG